MHVGRKDLSELDDFAVMAGSNLDRRKRTLRPAVMTPAILRKGVD